MREIIKNKARKVAGAVLVLGLLVAGGAMFGVVSQANAAMGDLKGVSAEYTINAGDATSVIAADASTTNDGQTSRALSLSEDTSSNVKLYNANSVNCTDEKTSLTIAKNASIGRFCLGSSIPGIYTVKVQLSLASLVIDTVTTNLIVKATGSETEPTAIYVNDLSADGWTKDNSDSGAAELTVDGLKLTATSGQSISQLKLLIPDAYALLEYPNGAIEYEIISGSKAPSIQLTPNFNGTWSGRIVGEPSFYGDDWWGTKEGAWCPQTTGSGTGKNSCHGTLQEWANHNPGATIYEVGVKLNNDTNPDFISEVLVKSLTVGGVKYIFQLASDTVQPTVTPNFTDGTVMSKADAANISFQFDDNVGLARVVANRGQILENGTCQTGGSSAFKPFGGDMNDEQNLTLAADSSDLSSGVYCFKLAATDRAGNKLENSDKNGQIVAKFSIDNDAPVVTLNNPQNNNFVNANTEFSITATDDQAYDSGVARVIAHFTDSVGNVCYPDKNGLSGDTYTYKFTLGGSCAGKLQDGQITLKYSAIDAVGNGAKVQTAAFTLDTIAPALESVKINGQVVSENQVISLAGSDSTTFEITVTDDNIKDIYAKLQTPGSVQIGPNVKNVDGSTTVTWSVPTSEIADGNYMFWIPATDLAGNGANLTFYFAVDSTAPKVTRWTVDGQTAIPASGEFHGVNKNINVQVYDKTGVTYLTINGREVTSGDGKEYRDIQYFVNLWSVEGENTIYARDAAGNELTFVYYIDAASQAKTVTFMSDGVAVSTANVNSGATVDKPADPTRDGYNFVGWYSDANFAAEFDFAAVITDNLTLYAKWTPVVNSGENNNNNSGSTTSPNNGQNNQSTDPNNTANSAAASIALTPVASRNSGAGSTSGSTQTTSTDATDSDDAETSNTTEENSAINTTSVNQSNASEDSTGEVLGARDSDSWSLANLILAGLTALISIILLLAWLGKSKNADNRHGLLRALTLLPAVGAVVAFLMLEDWSLPMTFVNVWTWLMIGILAVQIVLAVLATRHNQPGERKARLNEN